MACDLTVLVPVYNEVNTVESVLDALSSSLEGLDYEVVIVDDASTDGSGQLLTDWYSRNRELKPNYRLVQHPRNRGKGAGIQTALDLATGRYFLVQDADLEYAPACIPGLLQVAMRENLEVVYGSRFLGTIRNMPRANLWANRLYNLIVRRLYGVQITDMHTCYKLIRVELLRELQLRSEGFDYATELVSKLLRRGVAFRELPIEFSGRTVKQGKKIGPVDGFECLYKLVAYRVMPLSRLGIASPGSRKIVGVGTPTIRNTVAEHPGPDPAQVQDNLVAASGHRSHPGATRTPGDPAGR